MLTRFRRWLNQPAVVAMLLAPAGTELITGNMPPPVFFFPPVFAILVVLYGGGVILVHELLVRWGRGWPSLIALALAYGIFEEGILVRTFFNPNAGDIDPGGDYGRWFGVSWVEATRLTLFHAFFAIAIPLLITGFFFPERKAEPWVKPRTARLLAVLMVLEVPMGWLMMPYRPSATGYLVCLGVMFGLIALARILPNPRTNLLGERGWDRRLMVHGYLASLLLFLIGWVLPALAVPGAISLGLLAGLAGVVLFRLIRGGFALDGLLALAAGGLGFYASISPLLELTGRRGSLIVGIVAIVLLIRLGRRARALQPVATTGICLAA